MLALPFDDWFEVVFHFIHTWDAQMRATQRTTREWFEWANAQGLAMGDGPWGNSNHGWVSNVIYPAGCKVDGDGTVPGAGYVSLQDNNVGRKPETSPSWWQIIAEPGIGADEALFAATTGTTKLAAWDHAQAYKLSGHLFQQGPGVNTLVCSRAFTAPGQFVNASPGTVMPCVRMSLTDDTCYGFAVEQDVEVGSYINFYKITSGSMALAHRAYVAQDLTQASFYGHLYYALGNKLGVALATSTVRTIPANATLDPLRWQGSYTFLYEWTDPSPIPLAGHEHVGFRVQDGSAYAQATHEACGGSFSTLSALAGTPSGNAVTLSGTRRPGTSITVIKG